MGDTFHKKSITGAYHLCIKILHCSKENRFPPHNVVCLFLTSSSLFLKSHKNSIKVNLSLVELTSKVLVGFTERTLRH